MPKLLRAVELPNRTVTILISLPQGYRNDLRKLAVQQEKPESIVLQAFLDWGWEQFARLELLGAMAAYRFYTEPWTWGNPATEQPEWLRELLSRRQKGEHGVVLTPYITLRHWALIAEPLQRVEAEFYQASLSDAMRLFFAWGWRAYQQQQLQEGGR